MRERIKHSFLQRRATGREMAPPLPRFNVAQREALLMRYCTHVYRCHDHPHAQLRDVALLPAIVSTRCSFSKARWSSMYAGLLGLLEPVPFFPGSNLDRRCLSVRDGIPRSRVRLPLQQPL